MGCGVDLLLYFHQVVFDLADIHNYSYNINVCVVCVCLDVWAMCVNYVC